MSATCVCDLEADFDEQVAERDLATYRRNGLSSDERRMLAAMLGDDVEGRTILDIGGGIGAIHHELLRAGARSVTDVDGSTAYLETAKREAGRQGHLDRITYHHGDFVELADEVESADTVILLRVLCCYPDMPTLIRASADHARRAYGLVYPRSTWWMRAAATAYDVLRPMIGLGAGPGYIHQERDIDAAVRREGLEPVVDESTSFWRVVLYRRVAAAGSGTD